MRLDSIQRVAFSSMILVLTEAVQLGQTEASDHLSSWPMIYRPLPHIQSGQHRSTTRLRQYTKSSLQVNAAQSQRSAEGYVLCVSNDPE